VVVVVVIVMGRLLKLAGEIYRRVERVLGDGLALKLLSLGVRGIIIIILVREIVFDSASARSALRRCSTAHVP
jgi:hypothetical protein